MATATAVRQALSNVRREIRDDVHYVDEDGNLFFDLDCVMQYYGIRYVD